MGCDWITVTSLYEPHANHSLHPARITVHLFSEQELLNALRALPPEAHVFVRLRTLDPEKNSDREPDFLVARPGLGLVIVEFKDKGVEPQADR